MRSCLLLTTFVLLAALALAPTASGQRKRPEPPPPVSFSQPLAAAPGKTTEITFPLPADSPAAAAKPRPIALWTSFPAEISFVSASAEGIRYRLTVPRDTAVGIGAVRLFTTAGPANAQLFMVDDLLTAEATPAAPPTSASGESQRIVVPPVAVEGSCTPLKADRYAFKAIAGQRLAFEVVANRLGSRLDPVLRLIDAHGSHRELLWCDDAEGVGSDARFAWTCTADGDYIIEVRDANYEGGPEYRYRLRIGDFPLITATFPLAVQRDVQTRLAFCGPDGDRIAPLAAFTLRFPVTPVATTQPVSARFANGGDSCGFTTVLPALTSAPDLLGGSANVSRDTAMAVPAVPCAISARFAVAGEWRHFYRLDERAGGERLAIRARTRTIGLPCDVILRLASPAGGRGTDAVIVAESKPGPGESDDMLEARLPAAGSYLLSVEEINHRCGPSSAYRLEIEPAGAGGAGSGGPGFGLSVETDRVPITPEGAFHLKVKCTRRGYDGPIALALHPGGSGSGDAARIEPKDSSAVIAAGKTEADVEAKLPPETRAISFTVTGTARLNGSDVTMMADTAPVLRKLFPRLQSIPGGLDGQIGAAMRD
jgi:hypothetical protein